MSVDRSGALILIVDDERDLRALLDFNLRLAGYRTAQAATGSEALAQVESERPDIVLLDLNLPDISGTDVCRRLKTDPATRDIAILMLTARGGESDRIAGFELGAEDYVAKPFSVRELVLRIDVACRRFVDRHRGDEPGSAAPSATKASAKLRQCGPIELDPEAFLVRVDGAEVRLALLEFRLLSFLMDAGGKVRTRDELLKHVWGYPIDRDSRTIETHVKRLRAKLGPAGERIETVRSIGYRLRY
jgi:two-component system phosphate regulon response regulator PhoB